MSESAPKINLAESLDTLFSLRSAITLIDCKYGELRKQAVPPEVRQALSDLDAKRDAEIVELQAKNVALEAQIKAQVLETGEGAKGQCLQVTKCNGKTTWDAKILTKLAEKDKTILTARKTGEPYVQIAPIKLKD